MSIEQSERIALMEQQIKNARMLRLIDSIRMALNEYEQVINKKLASNHIDSSIDLKIIRSLLNLLEGDFTNSTEIKSNKDVEAIGKVHLSKIKEEIKKIEQQVIKSCLSTQTDKIYEKIKTLLNNLIRLFAPLEGYSLINQATQTLTNTRSALFHQVQTMEKTLNPPEKTEPLHYYRAVVTQIYS